jgi:hypothetical protein
MPEGERAEQIGKNQQKHAGQAKRPEEKKPGSL